MAERKARPARMLAGNGAGRAVMRNGAEAKQPRPAESTTDVRGLEALEEISSNARCSKELSLAHLQKANLVRCDRKDTRLRLGERELHFDDFLDAPPSSCLKVPVQKVLAWLPNIGVSRARELTQVFVAGQGAGDTSVLVRELTARGRYMLSAIVKPFAYPDEIEGEV